MTARALVVIILFTFSIHANAQSRKSAKQDASTLLFSVNKKPTSTNEFIYLYKKNHQDPDNDFTDEKINEYLTLYINFKLKVEEARRRGMDTTAAFRKEFNQYKEELRKPYLPGNNMTDSLVRLTYERMKEEIHAAHILVTIAPDASPADTLKAFNKIMEIRKRVLSGEDFGEVASKSSEDPSARSNSGDLGYFTAMQMVYPFENAAFTTPVGQVSNPVRTRFGYHILKVIDRRPARGEVEVSHIMIRAGEDKSDAQAKNMIFDVYNELQAGGKWEDVCRQYSEDPSSKENGGKLRPFGSGMMSNVPEFERVAFELEKPGDISDPVQSQYGWHILRLERKIPLAPLEEITSNLRSRVNRDERSQISKQALQTKLRRDFNFTEVAAAKQRILGFADTTLKVAAWKRAGAVKAGDVLFTLNGKQFSTKDFALYVEKNQRPNSQDPQSYMEHLYNGFIDQEMMNIQESRIREKNPDFGFLLNEYYEGILLFEIMEKEVWNKASDDSVGQQQYFNQNRSKYTAKDRVKATLYSSSSEDLMEKVHALLVEGDVKKLQDFLVRNRIRAESGYFSKDDKAVLGEIEWAEGMFRAKNNGLYYIAWIKEVLPAGLQGFDEARAAVISDYQTFREEEWLKQLRRKYPVKVNEKGKKLVIEELQKMNKV